MLFVSVDPDRDTPDRIGEYAHAFHRDTLAATADIPALEAFAKSLSLVFMKVPAADGAPADQYSVDHSAALAVLDPQGRMAGVIPPPLQPKAIAADLIALGKHADPMSPVTALTYVLPHRLLSSLVRRLAYSRRPALKQWLIDTVTRRFGVDLSEAGRIRSRAPTKPSMPSSPAR